jgi:hypothetical protein
MALVTLHESHARRYPLQPAKVPGSHLFSIKTKFLPTASDAFETEMKDLMVSKSCHEAH